MLILVTLFVVACNPNQKKAANTSTLEISFDSDFFNGKVHLAQLTPQSVHNIDSALVSNGQTIHFDIPLSQSPDIYLIRFSNNQSITLVLSKGETVKVQIHKSPFDLNYSVEGSEDSRIMRSINQLIINHFDLFESLYEQFRTASPKLNQDSLRQQTDTLLRQNQLQLYHSLKDSIEQYPGSLSAVIGLYGRFGKSLILDIELDYPLFLKVADSLSENYPQNTHAIALMQSVSVIKNKKKIIQERENLLSRGQLFPPIQLRSLQQKLFSLSESQSQIKIIYLWKAHTKKFWDTNPLLIELNQKYSRKQLQIIGISFETDKLEWANYCEIERMNWINLIADAETETLLNPMAIYPRIFILDSNNIILAKDLDINTLKSFLNSQIKLLR
jgi:hypothetical protein